MTLVWKNEIGGLTWDLGDCFVKWNPSTNGLDLAREAERMAWAANYVAAPTVVYADREWLVTAPLPGENAVSPRWKADPATTVPALGRGLRAFHDALPVDDCPFTWWTSEQLAGAPPVDRLVVCHGETCPPNFLLTEDGVCSGYVDLHDLGVADRWADLAVVTMALEWNYGPGWEATLLAAYGVGPDPARAEYYRILWNNTGP